LAPPYPPIEPPPGGVKFPDPARAGGREIVAVGSDFSPSTLLTAYRAGIFPWPQSRRVVPWCSPDPRATFLLDGEPHWSRSLRRTLRRHPFRISVDEDFLGVIRACGETRAEGTWIIPDLVAGYHRLHELGWAHSLEVWERVPAETANGGDPVPSAASPDRPGASEGREVLVGGIYGLAIGGLFAGESMFHTRTDASKIAFASLVDRLRRGGFTLFDVQVLNDHLVSLGCVEIPRAEYLRRLAKAIARPARLA
jgi:leucyl/phenylalanyl-tRNA--protein transferase